MPWLAAVIMIFIYIYNMPFAAAVVITEKGIAAAFRPVSYASALKAARKNLSHPEKTKKKKENAISRLMMPLRTFSTIRELLPHVSLEYFRIKAHIGFDDAACTALFCGSLVAAGHAVACRAKNPGTVSVIPDFNSPRLSGEICAVFSISVGDAINAASIGALLEETNTPIVRVLRQYARIRRFEPGNNIAAGG